MHAELAHRRIDRHHFGGEIARNVQPFLRGEDVEFVRVKDQPVVRPSPDTVPVIIHRIGADAVHIENIGVFLRAVADHATGRLGAEGDAQNEPVARKSKSPSTRGILR